MIRNYKNYNIQQRKDGRYTVTITDHGHRTYFYGRTKKEVADITDINFHTLRHTFATRCLESGMDLLTISRTLGHSSVKITGDVYLHMTQPHQKECLDRLNAVYF